MQRVHEYTGDTSKDWQQAYAYDRYGNRTIHQTNTWGTNIPKPSFTPNTSNNRLTPAAGTLSYDAVGNLTYDSYTGEGTRSYDGENRLVAAWANNQWQEYRYNGDGQRVRRTANGVTTWQVYGLGGELLAEYAASGAATAPQKEYGYRGGQLLVTAEPHSNNDNVQWLVADHLGTPRMILDRTGSLSGVKRVDNLPFGEEITASSGLRSSGLGYAANNVRQGFTGYEEDAETGLDFAQARYTLAMQGRFISPDPFGPWAMTEKEKANFFSEPQKWNRYTYVTNNPLVYADPTGLERYEGVTSEDEEKIRAAFASILKYGTKRQQELVRKIQKSNLVIRVASNTGGSGNAGVTDRVTTQNRINTERLTTEQALDDITITIDSGTLQTQKGIEGTLVHEGRHAFHQARAIASFSFGDKNPQVARESDIDGFALEYAGHNSYAEYVVRANQKNHPEREFSE